MKILCGAYRKDTGRIFLDGKETEIESPHHAQQLNISIIYQEFNLALNLSVAENIYLGRLPGQAGFVQYDRLYRQAKGFLELLGADLDPRAPVAHLNVAQQ